MTKYSYLALGDSYTIGEAVAPEDSFPSQVCNLLKAMHIEISEMLIIAKTGWTTDELLSNIRAAAINKKFDIVTLLVGVNDQYRGRPVEEFKPFFRQLLETAIGFAKGDVNRVIVLSIPDWGVTPFAAGRPKEKIAAEIDTYNSISREMAAAMQMTFIDITTSTRNATDNPSRIAADGLHPSAAEYAEWAALLSPVIAGKLR